MDGLEKITARISADADAEIHAIRDKAQAQAEELLAQARAQAEKEKGELLARGRRSAEERKARLISAAQMEGRKMSLAAKQEVLDEAFRQAVLRAREVLSATGDPQQADLVLDRACFQEMESLARACGSAFLQGYVRLSVDAANLRAAVRAARMGKGSEFLNQILLPGGNVSERALAGARPEELAERFRSGPLAQAAALGAARTQPDSGPLTEFERLCDNAVTGYLASASRVPFGEETVIGYLYAREAEITAVRIIMAGRMAGLDGETIRSRLRATYV